MFSIADFFFEKSVFSAKSVEFVLRFEKLLFYLKALQKVMKVIEKRFFVAQKVPEIYTKNDRIINSSIHVFASHFRSLKIVH